MYKALALKYRPQQFYDVVGQEGVINTIAGALKSKKLSHAYLFSGLRGSGKTTTARIFAKSLICDHGPTDKPCDTCEHCLSALEGKHLDIVEMDGASNRKIEDIRNLIENSKYKPLSARYKIYIIDEVHMLTKEAFNALLKTLEEPPEYVKFVLATTDPIKVPPTILSRTIHFRFNKIPQKKVVEHIRYVLGAENVGYEEEALEMIARSGDGSLRDTLTLLDQAIVYCKEGVKSEGTSQMLGLVDPAKIAEIFKAVIAKDRKKIVAIASELEDYDAETVVGELAQYLKNAFIKNDSSIPTFAMDRFLRVIAEAKNLFFIGADGSFTLILTLLKMVEAMESESIDELIAKYESRPLPTVVPTQPQNTKQQTQSEAVQMPTQVQEDVSEQQETQSVIEDTVIQSIDAGALWKKFIEKLYDRSFETGALIEKILSMESFDGDTLSWSSSANDEEKELLRKDYGTIKHIVQSVFGIEVVIKLIQKEASSQMHIQPQQDEQKVQETAASIENESIGTNVASDTTDPLGVALGIHTPTDVANSLLEHPLVKKTIDVFGANPNDVILHNKV